MLLVAIIGLSGLPAFSGESGESKGSLTLDVDVGRVRNASSADEFWWDDTGFVQTSLTGRLQAEELSLELRARALFSQDTDFEDDDTEFTGRLFSWDVRGLAGWQLALDQGHKWSLAPLLGISYRDETKKLDDHTNDVKSKLCYTYVTAEAGLRLRGQLTKGIEWVTEVVGGPLVDGTATRTDKDAAGSVKEDRSVNSGMVIEASSGVNWSLTKHISVWTGVFWEMDRIRIDEFGEHTTTKGGLSLALLFAF
jgi:hypothetical protein